VSKGKGKKARVRCFCGGKLRPRDKHCPKCYRVTRSGMAAALKKAAAGTRGPAFIGKSSARAAVALCAAGHPNRPGGNVCTSCAALMPGVPVPPLSAVGKSALAANYWQGQLGNSHDPAERELYQRLLGGQGGGMS
jgi:hypothetical protein